jgi:hypothetical protein
MKCSFGPVVTKRMIATSLLVVMSFTGCREDSVESIRQDGATLERVLEAKANFRERLIKLCRTEADKANWLEKDSFKCKGPRDRGRWLGACPKAPPLMPRRSLDGQGKLVVEEAVDRRPIASYVVYEESLCWKYIVSQRKELTWTVGDLMRGGAFNNDHGGQIEFMCQECKEKSIFTPGLSGPVFEWASF